MKTAMRFLIGLALAGDLLALGSPWLHDAVVVARMVEAGRAVFPIDPDPSTQTAIDANAPATGDLSSPSLLLRPRHLR